MIHIILLVLKIIGIVLLAILALCLLLLFFPVTYTGKGQWERSGYHIYVKSGWLFHILHFSAKFSDEKRAVIIRIFGIPIRFLKDKPVSEKESKKAEKKKKRHKTEKKKKESTHSDDKLKFQTEKNQDDRQADSNPKSDERQDQEKKQYGQTDRRIDKIINKIKVIFRKIYDFIKKIKNAAKKACKDVRRTYNKAKDFKDFISAETTKEAYRYGKSIILKAVKHVFPTKIKAKIHFGLEQPDATGKLLGYIAMLFSMFNINPKRIELIPDFDKKIMEGNINIKGHFFLGIVLIYILKFYFKKEIHDIIKKFH